MTMRRLFADEIHKHMRRNNRIWVLTNDLGYKMWDTVREDFPKRFLNVGASEQAMVGIAVGLALEGRVPIVYSITTFLLYRPFETIRNYVNHEKIPVKLIGSGRGRDYTQDGISHWPTLDKELLVLLPNIESHWPEINDEIPELVSRMLKSNKPWYINLRR